MKKRVAELLAIEYGMKYRTHVRVCGVNVCRIDHGRYYIESILCLAGLPALYVTGYWNIDTDDIWTTAKYWKGEVI